MRALRSICYVLLSALLIFSGAALIALRNQNKIVAIVLARIHERTGLQVQISGSRIGLGTHLVVVLEHPRILAGGVETARLHDVRAVLSYSAIFSHGGLPLLRLVLDHPRVTIPMQRGAFTIEAIPRLGPQTLAGFRRGLDAVADTARDIELVDAAFEDQNGAGLLEHLDLRAHRRYSGSFDNWPWLLSFAAIVQNPPVDGLRISGKILLTDQRRRSGPVAIGELWFRDLRLIGLDFGKFKSGGKADGDLTLGLDNSGRVGGKVEVNVRKLMIAAKSSAERLELGDYQVITSYNGSSELIELPAITVRQGSAPILSGSAAVKLPYEADRIASFQAEGISFELPRMARWLKIAGLTPSTMRTVSGMNSGKLTLTRASLETTVPLHDWSLETLRDNLLVDATLRGGGYQFPEESRLPPVRHFDGRLVLSAATLQIIQGSGELGASRLEDLEATANLKNFPRRISYKLRCAGELEAAQLYPAGSELIRTNTPAKAERVALLGGRAPFTIDAADDLTELTWRKPRKYTAKLGLRQVIAQVKGFPKPISLTQGELRLVPGKITIEKVLLQPAGEEAGYAMLDGTLEPPLRSPVWNLRAEVHDIVIAHWLPLVVPPDSLAADGRVSGQIVARSAAAKGSLPTLSGKLTLAGGQIQFGFLRAPVITSSATLALDGKGLVLDIADGLLENSRLSFRLAVADLAHPLLRIDANADRLDFEVMRFLRLPWSPPSAPHFFAIPAQGHLAASVANFSKLPMTMVATDFSRNATDWQIDNFVARAFEGGINLKITGRTGPDNWIHMIGKIENMDAAPLLLMSGESRKAPLIGKLFAHGDLWANTDTDFFSTLGGTVSFEVRDGALNRFTMLSRVLSLIDLKSWLTANFPDPSLGGLPFRTLTADLKGKDGDFYTDNLKLEGPVMDIAARGDIQLNAGQVNLELGLFPFDTVTWIINQIPLLGANLAGGTRGLIAAYFKVSGSFRDPRVTPKPITSVAKFVEKMLGLPVNLIVPDTIK